MDNTQITARDGTWFLFADWQGMTRISLPGDRIKTDANLDRPHETKPLVLRPEGRVWSEYAVDIDPVALKKIRPEEPGHDSPDPLGGPEIAVDHTGGTITVRGVNLALTASGEPIRLGGTPEHHETHTDLRHDIYPDHSIVVFGCVRVSSPQEQTVWHTQVGLVLRTPDGGGRVAWCRPILRVVNGAPDAFRDGGRTWLADRDLVADVGYLVEIDDDGRVLSESRTTTIAGPWVFAGQVWWQPDASTLCAGARLGAAERSFELSGEHAGPGRLLRLAGRTLFLPWHGASILDLAPAKRGKSELSRKHKAADAPMYLAAETAMRPIREGMARRNVRVEWRACTRSGKRLTPKVEITGPTDLVTYILAYALQDGMAKRLASVGVSWVDVLGGTSYDPIFAQRTPTGVQELALLVAMLETAGISRDAGFRYLDSLRSTAKQRGFELPFTAEAEAFVRAGEPPAPAPVVVPVVVAPPEPPPSSTPEEARVIAELEGVLARDYALDPAASREGHQWYRFAIDGLGFQAGINDDLRVQATLCATDTDVDMKKLMTGLRAANKGLVGARFEEADCYIHARAACALREASAAKLKAMIEACRAAIASPPATGLRAKFKSYD